jgi:hypothetical protein
MALEETAFPFEEKAIEVHEKNLELMTTGIFNPWIEKSLVKLGGMMPGRYAKFEMSDGLIASIDRYAYRIPRPSEPASEPTSAQDETDGAAAPADSSSQPDGAAESEPAPEVLEEGAAAAG